MTASWNYYNPVRIKFGPNCVAQELGGLPQRRLLLVTTPGMTERGRTEWIEQISGGRIAGVFDGVTPNPTLVALDALAVQYRNGCYDGVIAFGGGSALDTGKILAVLLGGSDDFSLHGHFLFNQGLPPQAPLPFIAIPTTSGTGSEVTPFATVWDDRSYKKFSISGKNMFPLYAILDPELTHSLPWGATCSTALDALCQAFESIWNRNANPITLSYALRSAELVWKALQQGERLMQSLEARSDLMEGSLLAGLAISHTRTGLCHSISYPITSRLGVEHGNACALTMPAVLEFNLPAANENLSLLSQMLINAEPNALVAPLSQLLLNLELPAHVRKKIGSLNELFPMVNEMITPQRADNNLRRAETKDVLHILYRTKEILFR